MTLQEDINKEYSQGKNDSPEPLISKNVDYLFLILELLNPHKYNGDKD